MGERHDPKAFGAELVAAMPKLRRFCYAMTRSVADADDLLQTTLERAWSKRGQFEPGTAIEGWLFRICRNLWIDQIRKHKRQGKMIEMESETQTPTRDAEREMIASITLNETREAMEALSERDRSVLFLVGVEGLSYSEAAGILDVPVGTVMSRVSRARSQLAHEMQKRKKRQ